MGFIRVKGIDFPVAIDTVAYYKTLGSMGEQAMELMLTVGGFLAGFITAEAISNVLSSDDFPEDTKAIYRDITPGPIIVILKDVVDKMSEEEAMALLFHEQCHILNNHIDLAAQKAEDIHQMESSEVKLIVNIENEIAADKYSALKTSPGLVKEGLLAAVRATEIICRDFTNNQEFSMMDEFITHPITIARFKALEELE